VIALPSAPALELLALALAYYRDPLSYPQLPKASLPAGIEMLFKLAAGCSAQEYGRLLGVHPDELRKAAEFFVQQMLFARNASHYRVLGLDSGATVEQIREHHRLLMRLFHPDHGRVRETWSDGYARRVNEAYTVLRKPESRRAYDALREGTGDHGHGESKAALPRLGRRLQPLRWRDRHLDRLQCLSALLLVNLPKAVLGGSALVALLCVLGVYLVNRNRLWPDLRELAETTEVVKRHSETASLPVDHGAEMGQGTARRRRTEQPIPKDKGEPDRGLLDLTLNQKGRWPEHSESGVTAKEQAQQPHGSHQPRKARSARGVAPVSGEPRFAAVLSDTNAAISPRELEALLGSFAAAYEHGDLEGFMVLFATAQGSGGRNGKIVRREYEELFDAKYQRQLQLKGLRWSRRGDYASADALFQASVQAEDESAVHRYSGEIRIALKKQDGRVVITGLYHETR
jgi:curved DNA-binding protein CbpA